MTSARNLLFRTLALFALAQTCFAEDPPDVLFIGNNYKDFSAMQNALTKSYASAGKSLKAKVAPVGDAWHIIHDTKPELFAKLYREDGSHPSAHGAYLAAVTIFATINNIDPRSIEWNGQIPADDAKILRNAAVGAILQQQ